MKDYQETGTICLICLAPMIDTPDGPYCERVYTVVVKDEPYQPRDNDKAIA